MSGRNAVLSPVRVFIRKNKKKGKRLLLTASLSAVNTQHTRCSCGRPPDELFHLCKTLLELIHTSAGIYELLLACIERMAFGADFHVHIALDGMRLNGRTAGTSDSSGFVFGMNSLFHVHTS